MSATEAARADPLAEALARAGVEAAQGWMRVAGEAMAAGTPEAWLAAQAGDRAQAADLHAEYLAAQARLWARLCAGDAGGDASGADPAPGDRRFAAPAWREDPYYAWLMRSYLLAARYFGALAEGVALEGQAKERLRFSVEQWIDALCPANFAATNPEAMRRALESRGESLARGMANLLADLARGRILQSDETAFELGRNLAVTPGAVVYENELIQLIQYAPTTSETGRQPLVMVPPCINKFYVLDLQPANSFVRYAVAQGHTVFMVSWRNPGASLGHLGWDDYLEQGVLCALRTAREIGEADRVNALGFCVGGTLLAAALAVLAHADEDIVASATFLTTMLDFAQPGRIGMFVDEASVRMREATIGAGGILHAQEFLRVFSALRANDLVWPYVVGNYLLGETPPAFDILYWNADGTNLPGPMYCYYLRNTYLENRLCVPAALVHRGVPVDLGRIRCPAFVYASAEDHIVPWRAAYRSRALLGGESTFVLGASGHIAGVINPPQALRRSYRIAPGAAEDADAWFARSEERQGSWWPRWAEWLEAQRGGLRDAPARAGSTRYAPIEAAPGRYVRERAPAAAPVSP